MSQADARFAADIADAYARWLVPMLFAPYARVLAARVAATGARDVLETAAGTGAVTRALAAALPEARIVATDLNAAMLDVARAAGTDPRIEWRVADAQSLPFDDASFDVVACQFGAMFFPDRIATHAEARRVLRAGGQLVFDVWDRLDTSPLADAVAATLAARSPSDPPLFMARTPHGYHEPARIVSDLREAGFVDIRIEPVDETVRAASARDVALAYCTGTPLRHEILAREPDGLAAVVDDVEAAIEARFGRGAIEAPMRAFMVEARSDT